MKKMLLSFSADVYERLASGKKIYEHRKKFPNETIEAYLYVSYPIQAITGKVIFDNRIEIEKWLEIYSYDKDAVKRIREYLRDSKYAMEIKKFTETNLISLEQLRKDMNKFVVPRMYYFLDGTELLDYLEQNIKETGLIIEHSFDNIQSEQICVH